MSIVHIGHVPTSVYVHFLGKSNCSTYTCLYLSPGTAQHARSGVQQIVLGGVGKSGAGICSPRAVVAIWVFGLGADPACNS